MSIQTGSINVKAYGAKGDGTTDDYISLRRCLEAAMALGGEVYFPPGNYRTTNRLLVTSSIKITGCGDSSQIFIDNDQSAAIHLSSANNVIIRDLKLRSLATVRNSVQEMIYVIQCSNVTIDRVSCDGSAATFVMFRRSTDCNISNCYFKNTLADGIHVTEFSKRINITNCHAENTGDDSFSVVSYVSDGDYCEDITTTGCTVVGSKARGFAHVGGKRVTYSKCKVNGTASSGFIVVRDAGYNTYIPYSTIIEGCEVINVGATTPNIGNQIGIEIGTDSTDVKVISNDVTGGIFRGITGVSTVVNLKVSKNTVNGTADSAYQFTGCSGMLIDGNTAYLAGKYGMYIDTVSDTAFTENKVINSNVNNSAGVDNIMFIGCSDTLISDNVSIDYRGTNLAERGMEINNCTNLTFGSNTIKVATQTAPFFSGTNSGHKRVGFITSATVPTITYYAAGQQIYCTADGLWYTYTGSSWTTPAVGSGGGTGGVTVVTALSAPSSGLRGQLQLLQGTLGTIEVCSLTVSAGCTTNGSVTVTLDGIAKTVALTTASQNTATLVATAIRAATFPGWTTGGGGTTVTFTSTLSGARIDGVYTVGTTGATGTMTTTTSGVSPKADVLHVCMKLADDSYDFIPL